MQNKIKILKNFDLFGIRPSLFFQGRMKTGTWFGFCLTVFLLTFTLICFSYFGQDLYYRESPILRYHMEYYGNPEELIIDPEITPIMMEVNSPLGDAYYSDSNLISFNVSQFTMRTTSNSSSVEIQDYAMERCRNDHFDKLEGETRNYFTKKNLNDYFCIPKNLKNLTIKGAFDQEIYQAIKFTVSICSNQTQNGSCLTLESIKEKMSRGFIGIYFVDYMVDMGSYLHPKRTQPKEVFTNFVLQSQKEIDIFLKHNYITTEDGVIFPSSSREKISNFDISREFDFKTENNDFILIYFRLNQEKALHERNYRKLQDLLAQIGGFINTFWIISFILNYFYSRLFIISKIIVNIFSVKVFKQGSSSPEPPKKNDSIKLIEFKDNSSPDINKVEMSPPFDLNPPPQLLLPKKSLENDNLDLNIQNFDKNLNADHPINLNTNLNERLPIPINLEISPQNKKQLQENEIIKNAEENFEVIDHLHLSILDYIYYYTGWFKNAERQKKKIIIQQGQSLLGTCLDIKYIIEKFYEIDKMKCLLLDDFERENFSKIPKPELKIICEEEKKQLKKKVEKRYSLFSVIHKEKDAITADNDPFGTARILKSIKR